MNGHPISWATEEDFRHNTNSVGWCPGRDDPHPQCVQCETSTRWTSKTTRTVQVDYLLDPPLEIRYDDDAWQPASFAGVCRIVGVQLDRQPWTIRRELRVEGEYGTLRVLEDDIERMPPGLRRRAQRVLDSTLKHFEGVELT